jgi:hypothetical protein
MKMCMSVFKNDKMSEEMNCQIHSRMSSCFKLINKKFINLSIHGQKNSAMKRFMNTSMNTLMKNCLYVTCHQRNSVFSYQLNSVFRHQLTDTSFQEYMNVFRNEDIGVGVNRCMKICMF